jgi:hypothetical protein
VVRTLLSAALVVEVVPAVIADGGSMHYFVEIVGWCGAVLILAAYALLSLGKLHGRSALYQWMNVVGSAGFVVNSGWNGAYPSAALNVVWMGIGAYVLLQRRAGK